MKPSQEQISMRAYEIFEKRGNTGSPEENWLQAEQELTEGHQEPQHSSPLNHANHQRASKRVETSHGSRHTS